MILIDDDALSQFDYGTNIYILDEMGVPNEGCDDEFGPIIVGTNYYQGPTDIPYVFCMYSII